MLQMVTLFGTKQHGIYWLLLSTNVSKVRPIQIAMFAAFPNEKKDISPFLSFALDTYWFENIADLNLAPNERRHAIKNWVWVGIRNAVSSLPFTIKIDIERPCHSESHYFKTVY